MSEFGSGKDFFYTQNKEKQDGVKNTILTLGVIVIVLGGAWGYEKINEHVNPKPVLDVKNEQEYKTIKQQPQYLDFEENNNITVRKIIREGDKQFVRYEKPGEGAAPAGTINKNEKDKLLVLTDKPIKNEGVEVGLLDNKALDSIFVPLVRIVQQSNDSYRLIEEGAVHTSTLTTEGQEQVLKALDSKKEFAENKY